MANALKAEDDVMALLTAETTQMKPVVAAQLNNFSAGLESALQEATGVMATTSAGMGLMNSSVVWEKEKMALHQQLKPTGARLAGDSRSDSPGYCAKYGTYSLLETSINKIIDVELVQSNEVASSGHMELEGLKRTLKNLHDSGIAVLEIVTDRHPQVRKYLRTHQPPLLHLFDAWHVSKGVKKQLIAAGKHRGCELIGLWRRSVIAHLYFAVGVGKGNGDLAIAVWLSLLNHIQDKHTGHGLLYPECKHGELERRKWILPGTDAYDRLHAIVTSKRLLDDIRQVSPNFQTFGVESFHSIINRFAPKCYAFSHQGQLARCLLSALHYNENSGRMQAATKKGDLRWQIKHPKARGGEPVACPIRELPTYAYVNHLLSAVEELLACGSKGGTDATPQPPHLSAAFGPVDKVAIVEAHKSRFAGN
ncbi:hypothetical protein HPB52_001865 [Rhipicephalus sanguineus]|uniref:Uncharacterized protein n=2 Tax=Rhipicephalus sanguineus TaxID=34632 RepID=A0A9D4SXB6_RHISA|nr:hypothetical protein HPB52_001865 [Rhipicephalus sanguineus]